MVSTNPVQYWAVLIMNFRFKDHIKDHIKAGLPAPAGHGACSPIQVVCTSVKCSEIWCFLMAWYGVRYWVVLMMNFHFKKQKHTYIGEMD